MADWNIQKARDLYNVAQWGDGFFDINEQGEVIAYLNGRDMPAVNLPHIIADLEKTGLTLPVLIRFTDILRMRLNRLCEAFAEAITAKEYQGKYTAVYPIKVNQERSVIEEIMRHGGERVGLEAGSKPELVAVLGLAATKPNCLIICNGYKDREYIRLAMIGLQLGHRVYMILEKLSEVPVIIEQARQMGIRPKLGIRIRLSTVGQGKWKDSGGIKSKFGFSASQLFEAIDQLKAADMLDTLEVIHFHLGSQVANIRDIYKGMRECARYYAELRSLGVNINTVDVGGGLAVDYDGTRSRGECSMNYSLNEYANNIVYALLDVCNEHDLPHPAIITESGRGMTAHHAMLVTNVIGTEKIEFPEELDAPLEADAPILHDLWEGYKNISNKHVLEAYHDSMYWMSEIYSMYTHGLISLAERARAEQIYYATLFKVRDCLSPKIRAHREVVDELTEKLVDKYFCNFSLFQSMPDSWAIGQIFPIMPLSSLEKEPNKEVVLQDLTCDSDGRVNRYVDQQGTDTTLSVPDYDKENPYLLGIFLLGAYQEILGDLHNLFGDTDSVYVEGLSDGQYRLFKPAQGDTVADVLRYVHFSSEELLLSYRNQLRNASLTQQQKETYLQELSAGLSGYTYLEE
jgi:arginine decarboxylase